MQKVFNLFKKFFRLLKNKRHSIALIIVILAILTFAGFWKIIPSNPTQSAPQVTATPTPQYTDFHLLIPKINVNAPVIADVDGANKTAYFKSLQSGVAHFKGTSKPGEGSNIFIFGHSSFYFWDKGKYKEVFKNLEDVVVGDEIVLWYNSKEHKYKVSETKVVTPDKVEVLQPTQNKQVSLMTCVPVGTTKYRLIVIGKPID